MASTSIARGCRSDGKQTVSLRWLVALPPESKVFNAQIIHRPHISVLTEGQGRFRTSGGIAVAMIDLLLEQRIRVIKISFGFKELDL
jgi:hypothetical protein